MSAEASEPLSQEELQRKLGAALKQARQKKGVTVQSAAEALRIRASFLEALEEGDWTKLPDAVYARAFARQYGQWLGISEEVEATLAEMGAQAPKLKPPATYPDAPVTPGRRLAYLAGGLFVLVLLGALLFRSPSSEPQDVPPPQVPDLQPPAPPPPLRPSAKPEQAKESSAPAKPDEHRIEVWARGSRLWLQLRDPESGKVLKEALLNEGERLRFSTSLAELELALGNAAAAEVWLDGKRWAQAGSLGPAGKVRRVRISFAELEQSKRAVQPARRSKARESRDAHADEL